MDSYDAQSRCPTCGADRLLNATYCSECGTAFGAQNFGSQRSTTRRWLPLAIGGLLVAALAAGAVAAMIVSTPTDPELATTETAGGDGTSMPSASPSVSLGQSEPSSTVVATPEPSLAANAILANRSIAVVGVDQLNVRASGSSSADVLGQLRAGARVFVVGAPTVSGDMNWYRVAVVSGSYSGEDDDCWSCVGEIGWVASPITGDPWLEAVDIGCPASPMTAQDLSRLLPLERLHCYGDDDIVVTGTINTPCCGYVGAIVFEPAWLAVPGSPAFFLETTSELWFRSDPATSVQSPGRGDVIRATGHLDDPAAESCRQSIDPQFADDEMQLGFLAPVAAAVLTCRTQLVISSYEVLGTEDLGPCCGGLPGAGDAALAEAKVLG